ncbi:metallophosphoesterase [Mycoplasmatota bacterium]|nr:metallophosphoesterase [Mycoplasmatota bacterium]
MNWINVIFLLIIIFLLMFLYTFIERYWIQIKHYKIKMRKKSFAGFKIVFLSDIHHSKIVTKRYIKNIVEKVNELKPDIIILGGDYVSSELKYVGPVFDELKRLNASKGVYGVLGNHDIYVSKDKVLTAMKNANIKPLDNQSYWINHLNDHIKLGGVSDFLYDKPDISNTISDVSSDDFVILVSHNPDYIEEIKNYPIDLMLSGHTHGGQVTIFGMYAPYIPSNYHQKFRSGLKTINEIKLIITNGVGVVGLPIRFFARPQIVMIELKN